MFMLVSPSILTCDYAHFADELDFVKQTGADMVHLDVMDGIFVPNLSFGPPVIAAIRPHTDLFFDVHLMMQDPDRLIDAFAKAGADMLNIHVECTSPIEQTLRHIRALGKKAAITIKPNTPASAVFPYLPLVDMVLVMTVEPGFGGQSFMENMLSKVAELKAEAARIGKTDLMVQIDGGVNAVTAPIAAAAGVDNVVVGSALFNAADPVGLVRTMQQL